MFSTLVAVLTIDRWGRRVGLWWGAVGQGIALILAGAFSRLLKDYPEKAGAYGGAAAFFVFLYTAVFGATWCALFFCRTARAGAKRSWARLTIPWVYPTETFPLEVRAKGNAWGVVGWSIGVGRMCRFFIASAYGSSHYRTAGSLLCVPSCSTPSARTPSMSSAPSTSSRYRSYVLLPHRALLRELTIRAQVWAFYPETANRTLEEIDMLFASRSPFVWDEERMFAKLKAENPSLERVRQRNVSAGKVDDGELAKEV